MSKANPRIKIPRMFNKEKSIFGADLINIAIRVSVEITINIKAIKLTRPNRCESIL